MGAPTVLVNTLSFADLLARSSRRTLFTIAFYQGIAIGHDANQSELAARLAARVPGTSWLAYVRALGPTDSAILERLVAEGVPLAGPVDHVRAAPASRALAGPGDAECAGTPPGKRATLC